MTRRGWLSGVVKGTLIPNSIAIAAQARSRLALQSLQVLSDISLGIVRPCRGFLRDPESPPCLKIWVGSLN